MSDRKISHGESMANAGTIAFITLAGACIYVSLRAHASVSEVREMNVEISRLRRDLQNAEDLYNAKRDAEDVCEAHVRNAGVSVRYCVSECRCSESVRRELLGDEKKK